MNNIEKLTILGILGDVRQRVGADTETDTSNDEIINRMTSDELMKQWAGWNLGHGSWWTTMKAYYNELESIKFKTIPRDELKSYINKFFYPRKCDVTNKGIHSGYVVNDDRTIEEDNDLLISILRDNGVDENNEISDEFLMGEAYKLEEYYYTEWTEIDDFDCFYDFEGNEYSIDTVMTHPKFTDYVQKEEEKKCNSIAKDEYLGTSEENYFNEKK